MIKIDAKIQTLYAPLSWFTSEDPVLLQGELATEKDTGRTKIGDGVTAWSLLPYLHRRSRSFAITQPDTGTPRFGFRMDESAVVRKVWSLTAGQNPSVQFDVAYGPDMSAAGTSIVSGGITCTNTTTGLETTSIDEPSIPAGSWVWVDVTAVGGVPSVLSVTIEF